jgi:hypothetical protein
MGLVCDWIVAVKVRGVLVVCVTCKNKLKTNLKTQNKRRKIAITVTTTITIITIIKKMEIGDTDNRKQNTYNLLFVSTHFFPAFMPEISTHSKQLHLSIINALFVAVKKAALTILTVICLLYLKSNTDVSS